ncbi:TauD/TfdA dioxygenase family protein [Radicibacter daui]|uniref:TauD/TfdA dioxygenase family protein n=1 Tax=Radicibacter daui TaxID=3064829 RepID=UPI004046ACBA
MKISGLKNSSFGLRVDGFDCASLGAEDAGFIKRLLSSSGILLFKNQNISNEDQVNFTRLFGSPELAWDNRNRHESNDNVQVISNTYNGGKYHYTRERMMSTVRYWHTDTSFLEYPTRYTFLYCTLAPEKYGETQFANTDMALRDLPDEERAYLENLTAIHSFNFRFGELLTLRGEPRKEEIADVEHPLVWEMDGKKALYLSDLTMKSIKGLDEGESATLITSITQHCLQEKYRYHHKWEAGDFLVFDSLGLVHRGGHTEPAYPRTLHRTTTAFPQN